MSCLHRVFIYLLLACLTVSPWPLHAAEKLSPQMRAIVDGPFYKHSHWGILVADLETGQTTYELSADKLFGPASTTKLFSMAAGLDSLGADYRFKTPIYRSGSINATGELMGDLILVASGDLTLGGRTDADGHIAFTEMDHTDAGMDGPMAKGGIK